MKNRIQGPRTRRRNAERGQAVVEMCILMTLFSFLVLGCLDMGRLFGTEESLTSAAREGAKVAAEYYNSYSSNPSALNTLVKNQIVQEGLLDSNSISNLTVSVDNPTTPDYPGQQIVQVSFRYKFAFYGPWSLIPGLTNPWYTPTVYASEATH